MHKQTPVSPMSKHRNLGVHLTVKPRREHARPSRRQGTAHKPTIFFKSNTLKLLALASRMLLMRCQVGALPSFWAPEARSMEAKLRLVARIIRQYMSTTSSTIVRYSEYVHIMLTPLYLNFKFVLCLSVRLLKPQIKLGEVLATSRTASGHKCMVC